MLRAGNALNSAFKGSKRPPSYSTWSRLLLVSLNEEQRRNRELSEKSGSPLLRFCALAYRAQDSGRATPFVLIVFEDATGGLRFLVDPDWRAVVQAEDVEYLGALLRDFLERAKEQPAALFSQLSSLNVGPLVTEATGENITEHPDLQHLSSRFVQL